MSNTMFSEVLCLRKILHVYTIPITTVTAARAFSALLSLKTYLRATMSQPRLNHAILLYAYKDRTDQIDTGNIATTFIKEKERIKNALEVCSI